MQPNHYAYNPQLYTLSQPEESLNLRVEEEGRTPERRVGRKKIKIEYIQDKSRRHITFSKRKAGIMKKVFFFFFFGFLETLSLFAQDPI